MHWSLEETRHYYRLMWKRFIEQGIDEGNHKAQQRTYVCIECIEVPGIIEDKTWPLDLDELFQIMRRISQPSYIMQLNKSRKKCNHYSTTRKVKMKL